MYDAAETDARHEQHTCRCLMPAYPSYWGAAMVLLIPKSWIALDTVTANSATAVVYNTVENTVLVFVRARR
jgi:hypothetical protein